MIFHSVKHRWKFGCCCVRNTRRRRHWGAAVKMMKMIAGFAMASLAMAAPLPESTSTDFAAWKAAYGKTYTGEEYVRRASIFADNVAFIESENTKGHGHTLGVGPFADMTNDEFIETVRAGTVIAYVHVRYPTQVR